MTGKRYTYKGKSYTKEELLTKTRKVLEFSFIRTQKDLIDWINLHVPKRTGELREDMIGWLKGKSKLTDTGFRIRAGTDVKYAEKITGDPAHHDTDFEHDGSRAYDHYGKPVHLDDPQAYKNWIPRLKAYGNQIFHDNIRSYKEMIFGN